MVKCAVIGCGLMGVKIAGNLAFHGHRVKMYDNGIEALNSVHQRLEEDRHDLVERGLLLQKCFPGQVLCMSRLEETVIDADFVFESVPENLSLKQDLFERISHCCKENALLCCNSLRLDVEDVFVRTFLPQRCSGLRFLFPVYFVEEVEMTPLQTTSHATMEKLRLFLTSMGCTMFHRSGIEPLILNEEQREYRWQRAAEHLKQNAGLGCPASSIPQLGGTAPLSARDISANFFGRRNSTTYGQFGVSSVVPCTMDPECAICLDRMRDCLLEPCHHLILCSNCAQLLFSRRDFCPVCRQQIKDVIKVYHS